MKLTALSLAALAGLSQAVDVQVVSVGKNPVNGQTGLKYYPEQITAKPGTMVQFQFLDGNHTVTQSNFDNPCEPLAKSTPGSTGFKSGFQPVKASADKGQLPVFTIMIKDTKPIWVFCGQGPHCQKGMAMVINQNPASNNTKTLDEYKKKAAGTTPNGGTAPPSNGGSNTGTAPPANGAVTSVAQPSGTASATPSTPVTGGASTVGGSLSVLAAIGAAFLLV